jgi:chromosome segregation ATPase
MEFVMTDYTDYLFETMKNLEAENTTLKKELRSANNQLLGTKRGAATLRGIRDSLNAELEMERASNERLGNEGYALRDEVETLKKALKSSKSNTSLVLSCEAGLEDIIKAKNKDIAELGAQIVDLDEELGEAQAAVKSAGKSLTKQADTINEKNTQIDHARRIIEELTAKVERQDASINILGADIDTLKQQLYVKHYPEQDLIDSREKVVDLTKQLKDCKDVRNGLRSASTICAFKLRKAEDRLFRAKCKITNLEAAQASQQVNDNLQQQIEVLELKVRTRDTWIVEDRKKMEAIRDMLV